MRAGRFLVAVMMAVAVSMVARAEEPGNLIAFKKQAPDAAASASYAVIVEPHGDLEPWIHNSMPDRLRSKIEIAFEIAANRVQAEPQCAALFDAFGADGVEMLKKTLYFPAGPHRQTTRCRNSFAITSVGGSTTWVCRKAIDHTDQQVAMALIHEALHHAGLDEYPRDRGGMDSGEINNLVMRSCDLR